METKYSPSSRGPTTSNVPFVLGFALIFIITCPSDCGHRAVHGHDVDTEVANNSLLQQKVVDMLNDHVTTSPSEDTVQETFDIVVPGRVDARTTSETRPHQQTQRQHHRQRLGPHSVEQLQNWRGHGEQLRRRAQEQLRTDPPSLQQRQEHTARLERRPQISVSRELLNALKEERHRGQLLNRDTHHSGTPDPSTESEQGAITADLPLPPIGAASPEQLGLLPSSSVHLPLQEQPNLSASHQRIKADVIKGSRRAFTITKLEYLKKEWCKTERFRQVVREEGCLRHVIINRFCYGQCNSFFIPKSNKNDPGSAAFSSCAICRPRGTSSITVNLLCPSHRQKRRRKRVDVVKQCKCMAQRFGQ